MASTDPDGRAGRWLGRIERAGNALPHPAVLFFFALLAVLGLSQMAAWAGWQAERPAAEDGERLTETVEAVGLLTTDGVWWLFSNLIEHFVTFPPLGILLVAMIGIGVAERSGLLPAALTAALRLAPQRLLTPAVVVLGILSSVTMDAGYVVLPPLAAALFHAAGRSPLAGLAASFAGVSAGFSANFLITALDPMLAGFTQSGAAILEPGTQIAVTANWFFMAASVVFIGAAGWWVTARFVEPHLAREGDANAPARSGEADGPAAGGAASGPDGHTDAGPESDEIAVRRGLMAAGWTLLFTGIAVLALIVPPGAPFHGDGETFPRWVEVMVPLMLVLFLLPGLAYGYAAGTLRNSHDVIRMMADTLASLAPYIVLAFFAAQFIAAFNHSQLGLLLAIHGGEWLTGLAVPGPVLVLCFVFLVMIGNLFIGSASAKYAFFAPVFVPMLMQAGIAPELTQAAYRVGDSVTNIVTPLNPYWILILGFVQRWKPDAGVGTLLALMVPYALAFAVVWPALLLAWMLLGWPLGPG